MKKLELKFGSLKEMLTKEQMKKISGGDCTETLASGGTATLPCESLGYSAEYCQGWYDAECLRNDEAGNNCNGVDCN